MLPYATVEEAEISLGRNLTYAENVWFNYSARKSDYILYCHNTLFLFLFYALAPLPWVIIELLGPEKMRGKYKVQPRIKNSLADMLDCSKKVMYTFIIAVGPLQLFSYPVIQWIGIRTSLPLPSWSEMVMQLLVYFLIEDYANYWLHRMLHCKWGFEKIHHIHHQYTAPIGFAAPYAHWAEIIILGQASFLGPVIVPCHMLTFWLWFILRQIEAIETHSGYEFPWSPSKYIPFYGGAIYHDYHHFVGGRSQSNFASVFTYCDYLYGTDKGYRYRKDVLEKERNKMMRGDKEDGHKESRKSERRIAEQVEEKKREVSEKKSEMMLEEEIAMPQKPKSVMPHVFVDSMTASSSSSVPSSPMMMLRRNSSVKQNCLCAPTTHSGSFRCRHHRNKSGLSRSSMSVGAKLSQLGDTTTF